MRTKIIISLVVIVTAMNSFAQKQNDKSLYTLCGMQGGSDCKITLADFNKCKKELTPVDKKITIVSFTVAMSVDSLFVDYENTGGVFSQKTIDGIDKATSNKKFSHKILIESVQVLEGGVKKKVKGMNIKIE